MSSKMRPLLYEGNLFLIRVLEVQQPSICLRHIEFLRVLTSLSSFNLFFSIITLITGTSRLNLLT
jgi:hypothetical protein